MLGTFNQHLPMILFNNYWYWSKLTSLHDTDMGHTFQVWSCDIRSSVQAWHGLLVSKIQELQEICSRNIGGTGKNIGDTKHGIGTGITGNTGGRARPGSSALG